MRVPKLFILIALSFSVILAGIGFAAVSGTLDFTGNITFQYKELYISNITLPENSNVQITGYSGTVVTVNSAPAGSTMTVTVTNPTADTYYYLNYTLGDGHELGLSGIQLGTPVYSGGRTVTFTVTFTDGIPDTHTIKFNFTLIPPYIPPDTEPPTEPPTEPGDTEPPTDPQEPTVPSGGNANATGVLEWVINDAVRGLNVDGYDKTFEAWVSQSERVRYCKEPNVPGGQLDKEFPKDAGDVRFTLEWINETTYYIYLYFNSEAESNVGNYITVYRQEIIYDSIDALWSTGSSYRGYALAEHWKKDEYCIEVGTRNGVESVFWYDTLPT